MQIDGSQQTTAFSRTRSNELAKGYYPTDPRDVAHIAWALEPNYSWASRGQVSTLTIFDPCAGEGGFLSAIKRRLVANLKKKKSSYSPPVAEIGTYAVELDQSRCDMIRGTQQKVCGSFFDMSVEGTFSIALLNPPYNRHDGELLSWLQKVAPSMTHSGIMVLIIPDYELHNPAMETYLDQNYKFIQVFASENYSQFKQVVVFLTKGKNNRRLTPYYCDHQFSNFKMGNYPTFGEWHGKYRRPFTVDFRVPTSPLKPLIVAKDLEPLYQGCADQVGEAAGKMLARIYPQAFDASIRPLMTLRTAHAVQLAAMNSAIESVTINGVAYLAKYQVKEHCETFKDAEAGTETTITKPSVDAFLLDTQGKVHHGRDLEFDYYDLNAQLSTILLTRLTQSYRPLHDIGSDLDLLKDELDQIGLMPPQKEAVKAIFKGFRSGLRGMGIRANTGTGKTWMAKAIKLVLPEVKRTVFVTEPHLVPQIAQEFAGENFAVHVIESWSDMKRLAKERPEGLYLIAYSRQRMFPAFAASVLERKILTTSKDGQKTFIHAPVCPDCWQSLEGRKIRKADKEKCPCCGSSLYTYLPENQRPVPSFKGWVRQIEAGHIVHVTSHNKQLPYVSLLKKIGFDLGIFDELHNVSNLLSNQGSSFLRLAATCGKVLGLTATITNGTAKSLFNILWGLTPYAMEADGWNRQTATEFQARYGAFKEVRKSDENNRHRGSERVTTYDSAGISPSVLLYTLPVIANVDSKDFTDLPPVHHEVVRCQPHPEVEHAIRAIEKIIDDAEMTNEDRLALSAVKNSAILRVADTFNHFNDELSVTLRGEKIELGTVYRRSVTGLTDKETKLIGLVNEALERGEKVLLYTGNTQHSDMRPVLKALVKTHTRASVDVLADSVPARKVVEWLANASADVIVVPFKRVGTGTNVSERPVIIWYDYTSISRLAEQGDGRNRRVNTTMIHRALYGSVRTCRYYYLVTGQPQELQLSYTLEKRMVAKLCEGETPEIDPSQLGSLGEQSFSALLTKALQSGEFNYPDPSALLKKMTERENARLALPVLVGQETSVAVAAPVVESCKVPATHPAARPTQKMEQLALFGEWANVA